MSKTFLPSNFLFRTEWVVAVSLTLLIAGFHLQFWQQAGGLWRDEVVSATIAGGPSLEEGYQQLKFESFPGFFHCLLRGWSYVTASASDSDLRLFCLLVGLGIVVLFWVYARYFGIGYPFISLTVFGLSPAFIRGSDSVRAYGLGLLVILFCFGLVWRLIEKPGPGRFALAVVAAILSVQTLYQNAFLLLAICLAGALLSLQQGKWKKALLVVSVGIPAALSLLIYLPIFAHLSEMKAKTVGHVSLLRLLSVFYQSLAESGFLLPWIFALLVLWAVKSAFEKVWNKGGPTPSDPGRNLVLYSLVVLVGGGVFFFAWLIFLGLPSQVWYFTPLLGLMTLCLDAILGTLTLSKGARIVRVAAVIVLAAQILPHTFAGVKIRQTNLDLWAGKIGQQAEEGDLILINPFYCGITFARYFNGPVEWTTLPPLSDYRAQGQGPEQVMLAMQEDAPIQAVLDKMKNVLQSGHTIWLVGGLGFVRPGEQIPDLPPAPRSQWGWDYNVYTAVWSMQAGAYLQRHASDPEMLPKITDQAVNPFEDLQVLTVKGWR